MRSTIVFAEGLGAGAGAGLILILGALLLLTRPRAVSTGRRVEEAPRSGRSRSTGAPPSNYLDVCRAAGL